MNTYNPMFDDLAYTDYEVTRAIDKALSELSYRHNARTWIIRAIVLDVIAAITVMGGLIAVIVR